MNPADENNTKATDLGDRLTPSSPPEPSTLADTSISTSSLDTSTSVTLPDPPVKDEPSATLSASSGLTDAAPLGADTPSTTDTESAEEELPEPAQEPIKPADPLPGSIGSSMNGAPVPAEPDITEEALAAISKTSDPVSAASPTSTANAVPAAPPTDTVNAAPDTASTDTADAASDTSSTDKPDASPANTPASTQAVVPAKKPPTLRIILIIVAILVVAAGTFVTFWFFGASNEDEPKAQPNVPEVENTLQDLIYKIEDENDAINGIESAAIIEDLDQDLEISVNAILTGIPSTTDTIAGIALNLDLINTGIDSVKITATSLRIDETTPSPLDDFNTFASKYDLKSISTTDPIVISAGQSLTDVWAFFAVTPATSDAFITLEYDRAEIVLTDGTIYPAETFTTEIALPPQTADAD
jgi:hypothetical protein